MRITPLGSPDSYAPAVGYTAGWPVAYDPKAGTANLPHCYASVGVGRDLSPDTGMGGELYAAIGHGPRILDRVIAVVGRVVSGIEHLSSLPRGTEALGFYKERTSDVPIANVRLASMLPPGRAAAVRISQGDQRLVRALAAGQEKPAGRILHSSRRWGGSVQCAGPGRGAAK